MKLVRILLWFAVLAAARRYLEALPLPDGMTRADPSSTALATGRLAAQLVWWYLVLLTAVTAVSHAVQVVRGHTPRSIPLPGGTALLRGLTGLGVGLTAMTAAGAAGAQTTPPVLQRQPVEAPPPSPPRADTHTHSHTVAPGESFWSIAEAHAVDAHEVGPYWLRLIEVNRDHLVDPEDPDLLHPGQVLDLPPP